MTHQLHFTGAKQFFTLHFDERITNNYFVSKSFKPFSLINLLTNIVDCLLLAGSGASNSRDTDTVV